MFCSMQSLLRQSLKPQPWTIASGVVRRYVLNKQFSVSSQYRKDDTLPSNILEANLPDTYATFHVNLNQKIKELLESPTRFQKISEREERSNIPPVTSRKLSIGKILVKHYGVSSMKGPIDIVLYEQLLGLVQPQTVFELGSLFGGSALSIANTLKMQGCKGHVYSVDIDLSLLDPRVKDLKPDNLTFIEGDMYKIEEVFPPSTLESLAHPWVVIEDAHANSLGVLEQFHKFMKEGDYIVYDDTDPEAPTKYGMGRDDYPPYEAWGYDKLHTLKEFMTKYEDFYYVDSYLTDLFGYNATNNWNGYVRRMK